MTQAGDIGPGAGSLARAGGSTFIGARALDDARAGKWSWWLVRTVVQLRR
ncbi:hypothetical protein [Nocardia carnea]|nr:hypothetical protein [Nocardia carnea]